jgi:2-phospho-L-lactate guanylyltransferase (CobY/MobA/RfbA family)
LFARVPRAEARAKGLVSAEPLFELAARRLAAAVGALSGVDLLPVGAGPGALAQRGGDFAERLQNALADARPLGYDTIVVVPGDVPGLGFRQLRRAFELLREHPVVLGPSPDGGVYLLGCRGPVEHVVAGVRWQTGFVLHDLLARAGGAPLLPALADLDSASDLPRLVRAAVTDPALVALLRQIRSSGVELPAPGEERPVPRLAGTQVAPRGPPATP